MCNLYSQTRNHEAIIRLFKVSPNRAEVVMPLPAIFPANVAPVVRLSGDGERELVNLNWGFVRRPPGARAVTRRQRARRPDPDQSLLA